MRAGICYVVGAGEDCGLDFTPCPGDYVIAADGGLLCLERAGINADLVIGDFDTLGRRPDHHNVITLQREKDDTDTFAAVRQGIGLGYGRFCIYGGTGGRMEHTLANLQMLAYLSARGMRGVLVGREQCFTAVTDGTLWFPPRAGGFLSVFSLSDRSAGVYLRGLKFPLTDAVVTNIFPIGVSNEFTGAESEVTVAHGTLLVVFPREMKGELRL
jgi:thiamine pyrophosphokinase